MASLPVALTLFALLTAGCASVSSPPSPHPAATCSQQTLYLGADGFTPQKPQAGYYNASWPINPVWVGLGSSMDLEVPLRAVVPKGVTHREYQLRVVSGSGTASQNPLGGGITVQPWRTTFPLPPRLEPGQVYGAVIKANEFPSSEDYGGPLTFQSLYYTAPPAVDLSLVSWPGHYLPGGHEMDTHITSYQCPIGVYPPDWPDALKGGNSTATPTPEV
jgi:hypothetical protein